ncbi:MAG: cytochrome c biogenesis protein CcdA, partial [Planctomycetia bacterium]
MRVLTAVLAGVCALSAAARADGPPLDSLASLTAGLASPIRVEAAVERGPDGGDVLAVTAVLEEGWHLYSLDQKPGGPKPTKITVAADSPQMPNGPFRSAEPPTRRTVDDVPGWKGVVVEEHSGRVTWRAPLAANPAGKAAAIHGSVSVQLCRDNACTPPETFPSTVSAITQPAAGLVSPPPASFSPERSHARLEAAFAPARPGPGGKRLWPLVIRLTPEPDWHLYAPASTEASDVGQGKPTIVSLPPTAGLRVAKVTALVADRAANPELAAANAVDGPVALEILIEPEAAAAGLDAVVGFQTCTDSTCDPPTAARLTATLPRDDDPATGRVEFAPARYAEAARASAAIDLPRSQPRGSNVAQGPAASAAASPAALSLPVALLMGLAGGLILNLMPCVLPVLGLKLMSFAQQSGKARAEVFRMNLWYCAGLYAVFFALATASVAANLGLGSDNLAWGEQFTSTRFNVTMIAIVFAFALSFLGIWELPIPGFIGEKAGHVQSQEGPAGAFLKGVLSTVLATPCSGPLLGPVFGYTLTQPT